MNGDVVRWTNSYWTSGCTVNLQSVNGRIGSSFIDEELNRVTAQGPTTPDCFAFHTVRKTRSGNSSEQLSMRYHSQINVLAEGLAASISGPDWEWAPLVEVTQVTPYFEVYNTSTKSYQTLDPDKVQKFGDGDPQTLPDGSPNPAYTTHPLGYYISGGQGLSQTAPTAAGHDGDSIGAIDITDPAVVPGVKNTEITIWFEFKLLQSQGTVHNARIVQPWFEGLTGGLYTTICATPHNER